MPFELKLIGEFSASFFGKEKKSLSSEQEAHRSRSQVTRFGSHQFCKADYCNRCITKALSL